MMKLLASVTVLILVFISGGVLSPNDPASKEEPWVIIDGKQYPRRPDGRYLIDGVPTLAIEGKRDLKTKISTHAPTDLLPKVNLSDLLKSKNGVENKGIKEVLKKTTEQVKKRNQELNRLLE